MNDTTIFAWTEPTPPEGYPAYINFKRTDDGKCYVTVRSRGNGGRDQACVEVSPELLESLQCDLCAWLYRDDVARLMATPDAEVDAELRRLGIDPDEAARKGAEAVEGALRSVREVAELRWIVNGFLEWHEGNPCPDGLIERARAAVPLGVPDGAARASTPVGWQALNDELVSALELARGYVRGGPNGEGEAEADAALARIDAVLAKVAAPSATPESTNHG